MLTDEATAYLAAFQVPRMPTITGRMSAMTNSFVNSLIPRVMPTADAVKEALEILGMTPVTVECIYCGDASSEWDHLRPTVMNKRPTGYITEIGNLVPACGKCNQSKGNRHWRDWMTGPAALSPRSRGIADIDRRIERLEAFEEHWAIKPVDVEGAVSPDEWNAYWAKRDALMAVARESQDLARAIAVSVKQAHDKLVGEGDSPTPA